MLASLIAGQVLLGLIAFIIVAFKIIPAEGQGTVIEKISRGKRGEYVKLDNQEVLPILAIYSRVKEGDYISKTNGTFVYKINNNPINTLWPHLLHMTMLELIAFLSLGSLIIIQGIYGWKPKIGSQ